MYMKKSASKSTDNIRLYYRIENILHRMKSHIRNTLNILRLFINFRKVALKRMEQSIPLI